MLQYYLGISNPEELPDQEWADKFEMLQIIREKEKDSSVKDIMKLFGGKK
jgi:diadenosine tetraphosphate (Ap4A) HIT family hydrolase